MGLIDRVARIVGEQVDGSDHGAVGHVTNRVLSYEAPLAGQDTVEEVVAHVSGLGPLDHLLNDPAVTDILVNGPDAIWVDRGTGSLERTQLSFSSETTMMAAVERAIARLGLRLDMTSPTVDGRLPDGSRIHVAIPPATVDYPVIAIRRFSPTVRDLRHLLDMGTASPSVVDALTKAVSARENIIVSGGTGAGKTTLLNALGSEIPDDERIVTVEDAAELSLPGHVVRLEARAANAEGFGEITIRDLLRSALRLRPDRIILGEVRGPEALDLITALNTGHSGSMSTVHANSPEEALWRLETLALLDGVASSDAVRRQLHAAIDLVVQIERTVEGRVIRSLASVSFDGTVEKIDGD